MARSAAKPLIVVTVGTDHHPFDRLVRWVESWLAAGGKDRAHCLFQFGTSARPALAEGVDYLAHDELEAALQGATVVVCHGGPGAIMGARGAGKLPIVVPRESSFGEHVDDHQRDFVRRLAATGAVRVASGERELWALLDQALGDPSAFRAPPEMGRSSEAVRRLGELVEGLVEAPRRPAQQPLRVLYIGGSGRSGSTLLDRMLGELPGFWSAGELVHLWRRGLVGDHLCGCGEAFSGCPFWVKVGQEAFGGWESLDAQQVLRLQRGVDRNRYIPLMLLPVGAYRRRLRRYVELLERLYRAISSVSGVRVLVDSSKHASTAFLLRHVPGIDLRVVHLVRDSRGVAFSKGKRVRRPEVVAKGAYMPTTGALRSSFDWAAFNGLFEVLRATGTPVSLIRYESLVQDPRDGLARVLQLVEEPIAERALSFIRDGSLELGVDHTVSGNPMRFRTGKVPLQLDEAWRREMKPGRRRLVSALTAPLLLRYGYPVRPGGTR